MRLAAFIYFVALAVLGWVGLALAAFAIGAGRQSPPTSLALGWPLLLLVAGALGGTWAAVRLRPRRRASALAVDEFRRARRHTPAG